MDLAVTYVRFALDRPGLFGVMFTEGSDPTDADRVSAVDAYVVGVVAARVTATVRAALR